MGLPTPAAHDGMAAFAAGHGRVRLVRNHEVGDGPDAFAPSLAYDPEAGGGTSPSNSTRSAASSSELGEHQWHGAKLRRRATPWASWLTCEETTLRCGCGDLHQAPWLHPRSARRRDGSPDAVQGDGTVFTRGVCGRPGDRLGVRNGRRRAARPGSIASVRHSPGALSNGGISRDARRERDAAIRHAHEPDRGLARRRMAPHRPSGSESRSAAAVGLSTRGSPKARHGLPASKGRGRPRPHLLPVDERRQRRRRGRSSSTTPSKNACGCCSNPLQRTSSTRLTTCASARAAAWCSARTAAALNTCTA